MVKRTVSNQLAFGAYAPDIMRAWGKLFGLSSQEEPVAQNSDLIAEIQGTSQDPADFNQINGGMPQFQDIRQNQVKQPNPDDFLDNLRAISQLPLAVSESDELRQDALENLDNYKRERQPKMEEAPLARKAQLDPNEVMKQLASLPMMVRDSDLEREDVMANMQKQAEDKEREAENLAEVEVEGLPKTQTGQLQDPLEFIRKQVDNNPDLMEKLPEQTRAKLQETMPNEQKGFVRPPQSPEASKPEVKLIPPGQPITEQDLDKHPEKNVEEGAVEKGRQDPQIMDDLKRLNGFKDIPPKALDAAKEWQDALTKREESLNAKERSLLDKAESGQLTTADKVILGIAIAIPILLALRYGATAGLLSAGEGLKGYASSVQQQDKQRKDQKAESLKQKDEIEKERLQLREKSIDINKKLLDGIPDKAAREFLKDKKVVSLGDRIGIKVGDEKDALVLDANQLETSDEGVKQAREYVKEAKDTIGLLNKANKVIDETLDVLDAMPKDTGAWEAIKSNWGWFTSAGGLNPFGGAPLTIDIQDKDGKVRKVNAFEMLKQKTTALQDIYNKVNLARAALTSNVIDHWGGILGDPKDLNEWMTGQSLQTVIDKTQSLKDFLNEGATEVMVGHGFLREPLEKVYQGNRNQPLQSQDNIINQMRANPQAFKSKVK